MAEKYTKQEKIDLGELIAKGHRKFGLVFPRRPYRDDDDEDGGAGSSQLLFEQHPFFKNQPIGATSDLTFIISENNTAIPEAEKRSDEAVPELKKALENRMGLDKGMKITPNPTNT
jgi:hypothetical protein